MLEGVVVLETSDGIAGPFAGMQLARMGADVVKIEQPHTGDPTRRATPWDSEDGDPDPLFLALNGGKKSVTLDLDAAEGVRVFGRLAAKADIVIEDSDGLRGSPLTLEELHEINPALVLGSVSSLDPGPVRAPAICAYAVGGLLDLTGDRDRRPIHTLDAALYMAGLVLAGGVMGALFGALVRGTGQRVEVSAAEAVLSHFFLEVMQYVDRGTVAPRGAAPSAIQGKLRRATDGFMQPYLQALGGTTLEDVAAYMGLPQLLEPEYNDFSEPDNVERFDELVNGWFADKDCNELLRSAQEWRLAWSIVQDPATIMACPQNAARGALAEVDHPTAGRYTDVGPTIVSGDEPTIPIQAPPSLGQHNQEIYRGLLELSASELTRLENDGVI